MIIIISLFLCELFISLEKNKTLKILQSHLLGAEKASQRVNYKIYIPRFLPRDYVFSSLGVHLDTKTQQTSYYLISKKSLIEKLPFSLNSIIFIFQEPFATSDDKLFSRKEGFQENSSFQTLKLTLVKENTLITIYGYQDNPEVNKENFNKIANSLVPVEK